MTKCVRRPRTTPSSSPATPLCASACCPCCSSPTATSRLCRGCQTGGPTPLAASLRACLCVQRLPDRSPLNLSAGLSDRVSLSAALRQRPCCICVQRPLAPPPKKKPPTGLSDRVSRVLPLEMATAHPHSACRMEMDPHLSRGLVLRRMSLRLRKAIVQWHTILLLQNGKQEAVVCVVIENNMWSQVNLCAREWRCTSVGQS
jgi:hypothetical protein